MIPLGIVLSMIPSALSQVPAGTPLHIRLMDTVGSYATKAGAPVGAVLIEPVVIQDETVLPAGSLISGAVKAVTRVGLGIRHETAAINLEFSRLTLPDGEILPLASHVIEVDNGRERVAKDGRIQGVRSTGTLCYRVSGYLRLALQWEIHAQLAAWAIRSLLVEIPEPEIYYPAGTELTLALTEPLILNVATDPEQPPPALTNREQADLGKLIARMPFRSFAARTHRPADLTNVLLIGSREEITTAFLNAGWTTPRRASFRSKIQLIRAAAGTGGYPAAPMSHLLLDQTEADMSWQKGLNDVSKRHHIRLWKQPETWGGQDTWLGAATRDIDFAYLRRGGALTHRIESNIDYERDKVAYDLAFTSCASVLGWVARPGVPHNSQNATGDAMNTDTRLVIVDFNACSADHSSREEADVTPLPEHGSPLQRFARREILTARNDLLRGNLYWRTFEGVRVLADLVIRRKHPGSSVEALLDNSSRYQRPLRSALLRASPVF